MKKKILGLALIAIAFVTFASSAQNTKTDNTTKQEIMKGKKADHKDFGKQKNPYEGLNLTDAQKSQLQQLDAKRKEAREQQKQLKKEQKQRKDSTKHAERIAAKKSYLQEVKAIIGPEQYVLFLENAYVNGGAHNKGMKAKGQDSKKKGAKDMGDKRAKKNESKKDFRAKTSKTQS